MSDEQSAVHSVEPWEIYPFIDCYSIFSGDTRVAVYMTREDARRIVACVNALAGIPTEEIEAALSFDPCRGLLTVAIKDAVKARCAVLGLDGFGQPIADRAKDK